MTAATRAWEARDSVQKLNRAAEHREIHNIGATAVERQENKAGTGTEEEENLMKTKMEIRWLAEEKRRSILTMKM